MTVTSQRMANENGIRCVGVQFAPGFISNSHALQRPASFELKPSVDIERDETPLTDRVTGLPRARGG